MADWNGNSRAQSTTWITLVHLNQLAQSFADARHVRMDQLTFWGHADSDAMRKLILDGLSIQIDNYFTRLRGARYEDNSNREKALAAMRQVLCDGPKTVEDLAQVCDDHYKFWREDEENV